MIHARHGDPIQNLKLYKGPPGDETLLEASEVIAALGEAIQNGSTSGNGTKGPGAKPSPGKAKADLSHTQALRRLCAHGTGCDDPASPCLYFGLYQCVPPGEDGKCPEHAERCPARPKNATTANDPDAIKRCAEGPSFYCASVENMATCDVSAAVCKDFKPHVGVPGEKPALVKGYFVFKTLSSLTPAMEDGLKKTLVEQTGAASAAHVTLVVTPLSRRRRRRRRLLRSGGCDCAGVQATAGASAVVTKEAVADVTKADDNSGFVLLEVRGGIKVSFTVSFSGSDRVQSADIAVKGLGLIKGTEATMEAFLKKLRVSTDSGGFDLLKVGDVKVGAAHREAAAEGSAKKGGDDDDDDDDECPCAKKFGLSTVSKR